MLGDVNLGDVMLDDVTLGDVSLGDVALGNVIGSNMFNLLAIVGLTTFVGPIPVDTAFLTFDLWVMLGASVLLIPFVFFNWNITRRFGLGLTALYLFYVTIVLV